MLVTVIEQMFWKFCSNNNFSALELCTHLGNNLSHSYLLKKKNYSQGGCKVPVLHQTYYFYFYF